MAEKMTRRQKWDERGIRGTDYTSHHDRRRKEARYVMDRVVEYRQTARNLEGSQGRVAKKHAEAKLARKGGPSVYERFPSLEKSHKRERKLMDKYIAQRAKGVGK